MSRKQIQRWKTAPTEISHLRKRVPRDREGSRSAGADTHLGATARFPPWECYRESWVHLYWLRKQFSREVIGCYSCEKSAPAVTWGRGRTAIALRKTLFPAFPPQRQAKRTDLIPARLHSGTDVRRRWPLWGADAPAILRPPTRSHTWTLFSPLRGDPRSKLTLRPSPPRAQPHCFLHVTCFSLDSSSAACTEQMTNVESPRLTALIIICS